MFFLNKLIKKDNFWPLFLLVLFVFMASRTLIFQSGYFNMHDDLQMMRQLEMEKCFLDGQIPCRWVPDMGYGYGFPLFNFYPPLPYLTGEIFRLFGFSFVTTVKLIFSLSFLISGITMFYLSKEFFGKWGGFISSVFYVWAPYHSVDIYVRGAMNEGWALAWFPLILLSGYKLITERKKPFGPMIMLSLSWTALLLSHNLMVLIFTPVFFVWCLFFWIKQKKAKQILQFLISGVMALIFAAFFTLPAMLEQKLVHVDTLIKGYYEYIAHFASIKQLLVSRFWGYGPSVWGINDGMPYQLGYLHWVMSLLVVFFALLNIKKIKKVETFHYVIFFGAAVGWFAAFMAHQNSTFIWQKIAPMAFVQFPWRFLTLSIFGLSFAAGGIFTFLPKAFVKYYLVLTIVVLLGLNWSYFLPQGGKMGALTDDQKFTGVAWDLQRTAGIFDYLPNTAQNNPKDPAGPLAQVVNGQAEVSGLLQGTNWAKFQIDAKSESLVKINIFMFPNWEAKVDGQLSEIFVPESEKYGTMYLKVSQGKHSVELFLKNTSIRTISNYISFIGWLILLPTAIAFRKKINEKLSI